MPEITVGLFNVYVVWADGDTNRMRTFDMLWQAEEFVRALWA